MSKKWIPVIISIIILINTFTGTANAKSVYVIADTGTSESDTPIIQSYRIQDSNLVYQTDYNCVHPLAIGLAIDTDSEFLFVTHEEYFPYPGNVIELINAKTMEPEQLKILEFRHKLLYNNISAIKPLNTQEVKL